VGGVAGAGLPRLLAARGRGVPAPTWDRGWLDALRTAASPLYTPALAHFMEALRAALPDDAIVACDQTGVNYWMEWRFPVLAPRTFLYPIGSAGLGYGLPAALRAKSGPPRLPGHRTLCARR